MFYLKFEIVWLIFGVCFIIVSIFDYCCKNLFGFLVVEIVDFVCRVCLIGLFFLILLGDVVFLFFFCKVSKVLLVWIVKKEII